jgi:general secretion pathway protein B
MAPSTLVPVDDPALLPLSALPESERSALPPLKVSMHVYADDPAQRFMLVDGQRVVEGDRIGNGVVLVHIRRSGAEIDVRGQRLLLPNP